MNKLYFVWIFVLLFCIVLVSASPTVITGTVFNSTGQQVIGAPIFASCQGNLGSDTSAPDGSFFIVFDQTQCGGSSMVFLDTVFNGERGAVNDTKKGQGNPYAVRTQKVSAINYCYQESANVSNQLSTFHPEGDGNCGLNYSGSYSNGSVSYIFFNYSKPLNYFNGSLWLVRHDGITKNVSLPVGCLSQNILQLEDFDFTTTFPSDSSISLSHVSNLSCYNGISWQSLDFLNSSSGLCQNAVLTNISSAFDGDWVSSLSYYDVLGWRGSGVCGAVSGFFSEEAMLWKTSLGSIINVSVVDGLGKFFYSNVSVRVLDLSSGSSYFLNFSGNVLSLELVNNTFYNLSVSGNFVSNSSVVFVASAGLLNVSVHGLSANVSPLSPDLFSLFHVFVNVSDANVSFVNVSVAYPNGSVLRYNTSLSNGVYITQNFTAFNGTTQFNVSSDGFANFSFSIFVNDSLFVSPQSVVRSVSAGGSVVADFVVNTNTSVNLSFSGNCSFPVGINCSFFPNVSIVSVGNLSFVVVANSTANGSYSGNLTIIRDFDGRRILIPMVLTVSPSFGVPVLLDGHDFTIATTSGDVSAQSFNLSNTGTFNLSNCSGSFDNTLAGKSFVSLPNVSNLGINESVSYVVTFTNPAVGLYQGRLSIVCIASPSGGLNSLAVQPSATLLSLPPNPSGGGGGGSPTQVYTVTAGNQSLFSVETDFGAIASVLKMYPAQSRQQIIIVRSKIFEDQDLMVDCVGDFCRNIQLSTNRIKLIGQGTELIFLNISMPADAPYNSVWNFEVDIYDSAKHTAVLTYELDVSRDAKLLSKFSINVREGDAGFWITLGNHAIPKDVLYLLELLVSIIFVSLVVPKDKKYKDIRALLFVIVPLGVVLLTVVVY